MSTDIKGLFFKDQLLGARGLGAFGASALTDGILDGCEVTISNGTATIAPGHIIVGGRVIRIANSIEVGSIGAAYTSIVATVDLTQQSTRNTFDQVSLALVKNASLTNVLTADTEDINLSGTTHSAWLWVHDATGDVDDTYRYARSRGKQLLWRNENAGGTTGVSDSFAAQSIVIPGLSGFRTLEATFRNDLDYTNTSTHVFNIPDTSFLITDSSASAFNGEKYVNWLVDRAVLASASPYLYVYERLVRIFPEIDTLDIGGGYRGRLNYSPTANNKYMIPMEIYGVN